MSERVRFGLFEFDTRTGELRREGDIVKLPPQPARVLALLLSKPGEVVLRDELRKELWGEETFVDFERGLNFCVLQVRTALGDSSDNPRFVQTVPRKGYRFIAPVQSSRVQGFIGSNVQAFNRSTVLRSEFLVPGARGAVLAAAALLILTPLAWLAIGRRDAAPVPGASERVRIAVLPFVNLTGDNDTDYVVDGITDELIAQVGRVNPQRLGVIARTSVMRYRNQPDKNVADIGRELDVSYVVEGSIRRDQGRLRVTTDLVKVSDQAQVWSDLFEHPARDSMDLQADLGVRVARALTLELLPGSVAPALPRPTANAHAWDAYLRGRHLMNRGNVDDARRSVEQFEEAVTLDSRFASGWAQLAEAQHLLVMMGVTPPHDAYPRAKEAAARARALDDTLADAHVASGLVSMWYDWTPAVAARSFERALALNASHGAAHHDYAWALVGLGRFDEAVAHITAARDYDPLSIRANADIGWLHLHLRQPTEAARACRHSLALQPDALEPQACLERAYVLRGLYDEAIRAAQATLPPNADIVMPAAGNANGEDRIRAIWKWRLQRLEQAARTRYISPYSLATHYVLVGENEHAIDALENAYAQRVGVLGLLKTDPLVDPLRSQPRFATLLRQVSGIGVQGSGGIR